VKPGSRLAAAREHEALQRLEALVHPVTEFLEPVDLRLLHAQALAFV
jgi:hypothetical protein